MTMPYLNYVTASMLQPAKASITGEASNST